MDKTCNL